MEKYLKYKRKFVNQIMRGGSGFEEGSVAEERILTILSGKLMDAEQGIDQFFNFSLGLSDHAPILVTFPLFDVLSWNVLNGDDKPALIFTLKNFQQYKDIGINPDGFKEITPFYDSNNDRWMNILSFLIDQTKTEKPVVICLQEVGPRMLQFLYQSYPFVETHNMYVSDSDVVNFPFNGGMKFIIKLEFRVTFIPKIIDTDPYFLSKRVYVGSDYEGVVTKDSLIERNIGYKSALVTKIGDIYLVNLHLNWVSTTQNFIDLLNSLPEGKIIIVGDFNRELREKEGDDPKIVEERELIKLIIERGFSIHIPEGRTFIGKLNNSATLDQVITRGI
jgi:exonuclease III